MGARTRNRRVWPSGLRKARTVTSLGTSWARGPAWNNRQAARMRTIVRMTFGSHLYGTATPESDLDVKAVYLPTARDILLQQVRAAVTGQREKAKGEKNTADDVEMHGLHVSPDVDSVLYHLAGLADEARGWGVRDETFGALELLAQRVGVGYGQSGRHTPGEIKGVGNVNQYLAVEGLAS